MKRNNTFQLQSATNSNENSLCLTATGAENFDYLDYKNCSNGNINQDFFMTNNGLIGEIHALRSLKSKYCLSMADSNPLDEYLSVYMHSDCAETWEVLGFGRLKNVERGMCLGRKVDSLRVVGVDCDSKNAEHFVAFDSQYSLYNLHFRTASRMGESYSAAQVPSFEIDDYGSIPENCYNQSNSECDIPLKGMKTLTIRALTSDGWAFVITGDIGPLLDNKYVRKHLNPFPTIMDNDEYDIEQTYALELDHAGCYDVNIKTLVASSNTNGNFFIDGYGSIRSECYSKEEAECIIRICGRRELVLRAFTADEWSFEISGDVGNMYEHKTVPGGSHNEAFSTMDIDEYDYVQVFELRSYSSCIHRAFSGQCQANPSYMMEHCSALCNLVPSLVSFIIARLMIFRPLSAMHLS